MNVKKILLSVLTVLFVAVAAFAVAACNDGGESYSITFVADGKTVQTVTYSKDADVAEPTVPAKKGYTGAWESYTPQRNDTQKVNAVYTAKTYTVTLDYGTATGGKGESTLAVTFDKPIGKLPSPTMTGSEFQGWFYNNEPVTQATVWRFDDSNATFEARFANTKGIKYALGVDKKSYYVSDGKNATTNDVVILSEYMELPVTAIGSQAFFDCGNLTSVTIPSSVTLIGRSAFSYCNDLQTVTFGNDSQLESIGEAAFAGCSSLTSLTLPSSVTGIGVSAFNGCGDLTSITIPSGITSIGASAFKSCGSLASVTIPSGVTSIGEEAFCGCHSLIIYCEAAKANGWTGDWNKDSCPVVWSCLDNDVADDGYVYTVVNNVRYGLKDNEATVAYNNCAGSVTIPSQVQYKDKQYPVVAIGEKAFYNCSGLTTITISNGVTRIGENAFGDCFGLTTVIISSSVTSIESGAFNGCGSLQTVTFEEDGQLQSIGEDAFFLCESLASITIPSSVTEIGSNAFNGCSSLTSVTFDDPTGWEIGGTSLSLNDTAQNARYLVDTYCGYTWTHN